MTPSSYRLSGNAGEMNKLVNHRVQVTGTLDTMSGTSAVSGGGMSGMGTGTGSGTGSGSATGSLSGSGTGSAAGTGSSAGSSASGSTGSSASGTMSGGGMPQVRVTSVKDLGGSCSSGG